MAGITTIQFRRGTAAAWTSANPVLAAGEAGYETDTTKIKFGDGSTAWNSLAYATFGITGVGNVAADAIWDTKGDLAVASGSDTADNLPVGSNGQVLVADSAQTLGVRWATLADVWTTVTKASDESVTSSTVLQDDNELFFSTVAGGVYEFEAILIYASPAGAGTPDCKVLFAEDATLRGQFGGHALTTADAASTGQSGTGTGSTAFGLGTAAANRGVKLTGVHTGGGGTLKVQWAQNTSSVNATIMRAGSILRYRRII